MTRDSVFFTPSADDAALLLLFGYRCMGARRTGTRAELEFLDPDASAADVLSRHVSEGIEVNSLELLDARRSAQEKMADLNPIP